jgi:hypothetical protein
MIDVLLTILLAILVLALTSALLAASVLMWLVVRRLYKCMKEGCEQ